MSWKVRVRVVLAVVVALSVVAVGYGYATNATETTVETHLEDRSSADAGAHDPSAQVAGAREEITVVATDSNSWLGEQSEGPRALAEIIAFGSNGSILYYNDSHTRYWDVDPVPGTEATVEYGFADHLPPEECPDEWNGSEFGMDQQTWDEYYDGQSNVRACTRNGFERVNLSTGAVTPIWSQTTPGKPGTRYHDVDRLNETHLLVADIYLDRVFVVSETGQIGWQWNVSDAFSPTETGGPYPEDWSHLNDVELLSDGRIMASLRNHDRVVFLNRSGLIANWTLGAEDDYDVLYEQHNPDYIPPERGGPAVIVGDSENNRVVEYQRTPAGEWEESWTWRDARMQWPRDADRLPNGHTLITDSNGNRVFEVDQQGEVVWSIDVAFPYEAERLGTSDGSGGGESGSDEIEGNETASDESAGGQSARELGLESRTPPAAEQVWIALKGFVPGVYLNGLMYITPTWMGFPQLFAAVVGGLAALVWACAELYWAIAHRFRTAETGSKLDDAHAEDD